MTSARWASPAAITARLVVGGVWIVAGAIKLPDPAGSVRAVRAYDLLPEAVVPTVGHLLPVLEVVVGVCLVVGLLTRPMALLSTVMLLGFVIGIASAWARGLQIDCGCFGGGGYDPEAAAAYPWELARDAALMLASLLVATVRPRLALDRVLFPSSGREGEDAPADQTDLHLTKD